MYESNFRGMTNVYDRRMPVIFFYSICFAIFFQEMKDVWDRATVYASK